MYARLTDDDMWEGSVHRGMFLILALGLWLSGCASTTSMPPPPRVDDMSVIAVQPSLIALPLSIAVERINEMLDRDIPRQILAIDQDRTACLPAQYIEVCPAGSDYDVQSCPVEKIRTQVAPAIDCNINGSIDRGDVRTDAGEIDGQGTLKVVIPVKANAKINGKGDAGNAINGDVRASLDVSFTVVPDLTKDWKARVAVSNEFVWTEQPYFQVRDFRVPISAQAEPRVREVMSAMQAALEEEIGSLNVRATVEELWKRGFFVQQIGDKPEVWIRFVPTDLAFSGFSAANGRFVAHLFVTGETETFVGAKPDSVQAAPLPALKRTESSDDFRLYVPIFADYAASAKLLEGSLKIGEEQFFDVPIVGRVGLTFKDVEVYPTTGGAVAVGMTVDVDYSASGETDGTGLVWLKADMAIDNERQMIYPSSLDFGAETDSSMLNMVVGIARRTSVREKIQAALTHDFSGELSRGVVIANQAINREINDNLVMSGKITDAGVDEIKATPNGIYMGLHTVGRLNLDVRALRID